MVQHFVCIYIADAETRHPDIFKYLLFGRSWIVEEIFRAVKSHSKIL